jgi:hypothetical protein
MRIFLVAVGAGELAYDLARRIIVDSGAQSYADDDEFFPDGVQDPYRAVLVQREEERARSPLASITPFSAKPVWTTSPNALASGTGGG